MSENRLAHIVHQCAKMLVTLLEKEYGFGKKGIQANNPDSMLDYPQIGRIGSGSSQGITAR